jgi:hypothetical protein
VTVIRAKVKRCAGQDGVQFLPGGNDGVFQPISNYPTGRFVFGDKFLQGFFQISPGTDALKLGAAQTSGAP